MSPWSNTSPEYILARILIGRAEYQTETINWEKSDFWTKLKKNLRLGLTKYSLTVSDISKNYQINLLAFNVILVGAKCMHQQSIFAL